MRSLYSYVVRYDDGAAPNPFGGVCSLVICKPVIRRGASEGDWVIGTGSAGSPLGDMRGRIVYAMRVTGTMPMWMYDGYARAHLPVKVPDWRSADPARMVGDSVYDFSHTPPLLRRGVHSEADRERDLSGINALLSEHFFYFGDQPRHLPDHLLGIVKAGQGHRRIQDEDVIRAFEAWLAASGLEPNRLYGKPSGPLFQRWVRPSPPPPSCGARPARTRLPPEVDR